MPPRGSTSEERMAAIWLDGFDQYSQVSDLTNGNYDYEFGAGFGIVTGAAARTGNVALAYNQGINPGATLGKYHAAKNLINIGIAFNPINLVTDELVAMTVLSNFNGAVPTGAGNGPGDGFCVENFGNKFTLFQTRNGLAPITLASGLGGMVANAYQYLEMVLNTGGGVAGAGTADLWYNGNQHLVSVTGLTYSAGGFTNSYFGTRNTINNGVTWDDFYIDDANRLGAQRCFTLFPNADQSPQNWTRSSGANAFALINQVPYNPANYIQGNNVNDNSQFGNQSIPAANAVINGMRLSGVFELDVSGSAGVTMEATVGPGTYIGSQKSPSTSPTFFNDMFTLNPTVAQVNAMHSNLVRTA